MVTFIALAGAAVLHVVPPAAASSCGVEPASVASRSPAGLAQVSNLALVYARAVVSPPRRMPDSGVLDGLRVEATVHEIAANGTRAIVPSTVKPSGGGGDTQSEHVTVTLEMPIAPSGRFFDQAGFRAK